MPLVSSLWDHNNLYTVLSVALLSVLALRAFLGQATPSKPLLFGVALMVFPFLPASNLLFPVGFVVAERVLYLPSMGCCMLVALGAWQLQETLLSRHFIRASLLLKVLLGYLILVHGMKTVSRNRVWYSATTLNQAGVRFNPRNPVLLSNLGIEHAMKEDYGQAERLYLSSMQQTPSFSGGYYNYGMLMNLLHRYEEAEQVSGAVNRHAVVAFGFDLTSAISQRSLISHASFTSKSPACLSQLKIVFLGGPELM